MRARKMAMTAICLMMASISMSGQTVEKLFAKYKALPGAVYQESTKGCQPTTAGTTETKAQANGVGVNYHLSISLEDTDSRLFKEAKKMEWLVFPMDASQGEKLTGDLKALKEFEEYLTVARKQEPDKKGNMLAQMWNSMMNPSLQFRYFVKAKKGYIRDALVRMDYGNQALLLHWAGKMKEEEFAELMKEASDMELETESDDDDDVNVTDWNEVVRAIKENEALVVIGGKTYPNLHSEHEAREYMMANDISFSGTRYIVGKAVKEKYPDTDKMVVIEFSTK